MEEQNKPEEKKKALTQEEIRNFLIERCKDCIPYAPMILPEVLAYLECEKSGDWSGWYKKEPERKS